MKHETHGLSKTRLYGIYHNMKQRCYNPNATSYDYYGGKGVKICSEWLDDFAKFYNWAMVNGYREDLTIDRIDSNKGYSPENCRWITPEENSARGPYEKIEKEESEIKRIRELTGLSQPKFCEKYGIPHVTLRKWEQGHRSPPDYVVELLEFKVREDFGMKDDLIRRSELLQKMHEFCKHQRYLVPEEIWEMIENMPSYDEENSQIEK